MDLSPDVNAPEVEAPRRESHVLTCVLWALAILFVVYPLSIGPAAAIYRRVPPKPGRVLSAVYRPIYFAERKNRSLALLVEWYIQLWIPKPQPKASSVPLSTPTNVPVSGK